MSRRRIIIHAGTNRSRVVVALFRVRRSIFCARLRKGSLLRVLTATLLQSTTQPCLNESNGRRLRRRGFDSTLQRSARRKTRAHCVRVHAAGIQEISTGENHEISAFDCSSYDADERDNDLVQCRRLLRWRHLLPRPLLYDNDPIISGSLTNGPAGKPAGPLCLRRDRFAERTSNREPSVCVVKSFHRCAFPFRLSA
jgi:hypothetical protein